MNINKLTKTIISRVRSHLVIDLGSEDDFIILAGMGRSGTTWAGEIINYDNSYKTLFEPFLPSKVKEAQKFKYLQYINSQEKSPLLEAQAQKILSGAIQNYWVDRENKRFIYHKRLIKEIRCNLMLGWLKNISNDAKIILMVRHPLQVVSSWSKLGWGVEYNGQRNDFDIITSQQKLLNSFPVIKEVMEWINPKDYVENIVFQWCIYHLVPSHQLKSNDAHVLYYEDLLTDPESATKALFEYLDTPLNLSQLTKELKKTSSTNFQNRNIDKDKSTMLNGWKEVFTSQQIERTHKILDAFGLGDIYDTNGAPTKRPFFVNS